ncbi:MAG: DUF3696 domain-containing protein [Crocosphaera sp.]|nr:DUF3696 domain-containing protein [Crocosphaera sp.]
MIEFLKIENFKPFQSQSFTIKPLTVLTGLNSTGKSSVIQVLLLLRQSYPGGHDKIHLRKTLKLNGNLVKIGTGKDALFGGARTKDLIYFEIQSMEQLIYGLKTKINWTEKWNFKYALDDNTLNIVDYKTNSEPSLKSFKNPHGLPISFGTSTLFQEDFYYLKAERISPQTYFEIPNDEISKIGTKGQYSAYFLSMNENKKILPKLSHPEVKTFVRELGEKPQKSLELKDQVEAWMSDISPGVELNLETRPDLDLINLRYNYGDENFYRPTNIGFGVTYVLPILVAILSAKPGALIILENPESHLHPRGQSRIGQLMALAASCGIQIIVETHSDHILNGIRLMTKKQQINADDIAIHYFTRGKKEGKYQTEVISPKIYQDGGIDQWPDGFFDQAENDLMELL